jgi:hypothetical protein
MQPDVRHAVPSTGRCASRREAHCTTWQGKEKVLSVGWTSCVSNGKEGCTAFGRHECIHLGWRGDASL